MLNEIEFVEPLKEKLSDISSRPTSVRPKSSKLEPINTLNILNTKKFLPSLSPLGNYASTNIKSKKKSTKFKSNGISINDFQLTSLENSSPSFQDDWSREQFEDFFFPVEQFLSNQSKREKSSKRRCSEIIKRRNLENTRRFIENTISDFDEKISLNLLVKSRESLPKGNSSSFSESSNYRALIADEILRINSKCSRCREKNRRYEEHIFDQPFEIYAHNKNFKKNNLPNISGNFHHTHVSNLHSHHSPNRPKIINLNTHSTKSVNKLFNRSFNLSKEPNETAQNKLVMNVMPNKKQIAGKYRL
ncbi:unnamed protein product [Brachionus calyciflorus]|uniref:Uncharacterized protein n=1 Tax=Brachionus calyciflorus TaxID=104777 RepID=A0A814FJ20_9BILA|nr:unnamed protein product [Brachionus calyciflorus]